MNTNDLNTDLYEKMAAEQDKYRDGLKSQPPEEILHHTYEYTIREDIVIAYGDGSRSVRSWKNSADSWENTA